MTNTTRPAEEAGGNHDKRCPRAWDSSVPCNCGYGAPSAVAAAPVDPQWLADQVKNGIADFISDNWPDRRHGLGDIVANIQRIEVRAAQIIERRSRAAQAQGGGA